MVRLKRNSFVATVEWRRFSLALWIALQVITKRRSH
jgi:hypothetical protein